MSKAPSDMTQPAPYLRPLELSAALGALAESPWQVAAGCTDLFPATEHKTLRQPTLDVTGIKALRGITKNDAGLRIGATTTWTDIINAPLPAACRGLQLAAREVGARQIQNRGTIAGNLCNASPAADGVPALLCLDASVELQSLRGVRHLPLSAFILGPRRTALADDEIVVAVNIPQAALGGQGHFLKLGARRYLVISIAMTAARMVVEDGLVTGAALAIGACGPVATRLPQVEKLMVGRPVDPAIISDALVAQAVAPIDDIRADAAFRTTAAAELLRRTVAALLPERAVP